MLKFEFDATLLGADGASFQVHCEVQEPLVGGQKAQIHIAVPAQHITENPPENPCSLSGGNGFVTINMEGVHWRRFPTSSSCSLGLETVELLHVDRLTVSRPVTNPKKEIRFHLANISYLRSRSNFVQFGNSENPRELFLLNLPPLGPTSFVVEWVTIYHRDAETLGASVHAGFSAVTALPTNGPVEIETLVANFKRCLDILAIPFRQAVSLLGWTYNDGQTISTWIAPLAPAVTPSAREDRGEHVAKPQLFVECAAALAGAYENADVQTRSLVRHLSLAVNPHSDLRYRDHFMFMFSGFERVIESAWKRDKTPNSPTVTTHAVIMHLEQLIETVVSEGGADALVVSQRLSGLIKVVKGASIQDKLKAFFRVYSAMNGFCLDLWPILGVGKERGLREIRHALAHGSGSLISPNVLAVANWHMAILLERMVFVLLEVPMPEGISPNSFLLRMGGKGWYEQDWWGPLRSQPDQLI